MHAAQQFTDLVERVYKKSPFQKKKLQQYLSTKDDRFFQEAEEFAMQYSGYLQNQSIPLDYAVAAYLEMCNNMMKCQIEFMKTGKYTMDESAQAYEDVYNNQIKMKSYMIGLAISQFLWSTHYEMFKCLVDTLKKRGSRIRSYLEIGPGHGLFLNRAIGSMDPDAQSTVVDISSTSMEITKSIMSYFRPGLSNIKYHNIDMLKLDLNEKYDFITMGEVLEHVNVPETLLGKLHDLLNNDGRAFVSTCVDCPAIDHVYHFKHVEEIREMMRKCGFAIEEERVLPVENLPMEEIVARKITINYCAILRKQ